MEIYKSPYYSYRIKKTTQADESVFFTVEYKRKSIFADWHFSCNHATKDDAKTQIEKEIKQDNENYSVRIIKTEYL